MNTRWLALMSALLLGACASDTLDKAKPAQNEGDSSQITLAEAASSVSQSLVNLAATEQAAYRPVTAHPSPDPVSYGMGGKTSIDWSGPVEPVVKQISDATSYQLKIIGKNPAIPIIVTVNTKEEAIGNILSNIAYQCGKRADIVVYPQTHVIELRYLGN